MPEVAVKELLEDARRRHYAVGAVNVFNYETALGAIQAAELQRSPVILALYPKHFVKRRFAAFVPVIRALMAATPVPVGLHLDHAATWDEAVEGVETGCSSVMFDTEDDKANREVAIEHFAKFAHAKGVFVEAEVGHTPRVGVDFTGSVTTRTTSENFRRLLDVMTIDVAAICIGNVHAAEEGSTTVDLQALKELAAVAGKVHLSLHGSSGITRVSLQEAARHGVSKISFYTALSVRGTGVLRQMLTQKDVLLEEICWAVQETVAEAVAERMVDYWLSRSMANPQLEEA